jgi:amino acid transporter
MQNIKEATTIQIVSALFGFLILLFGSIYSDVLPIILPIVIQELPKTVLLKIASLATILFLLSAVLSLVFYLKLKNKLHSRFGVKWDKEKQAYCPTCESLLTRYSAYKNDSGKILYFYFQCLECKSSVYLKDDSANHLTLQDAQKQL